MQKDAERCQALVTRNTCRHTSSSRYLQTHAANCQPLMCAGTCWNMSCSQNAQMQADTQLALDTCRHMHTLAPLLIHANKKQHTQPSPCADTCTYTLSSRGTCWHALSFWHRKLNEDACTLSARGTCQLTLSSHVTCRQHILSSRHRKLNEDTRLEAQADDTCSAL